MATPIYHIVTEEEYTRQRNNEYYIHASLKLEGFIHCSYISQIDGVLARYYQNVKAPRLLKIDPDKLTSKLIVEPSSGGELYPHIYGPINWDCVVDVHLIEDRN